MHVGPVPSASEAEKYELLYPGSWNRLLTMAERTQDMQHERMVKDYDVQKTALANQSEELNLFKRGQNWAGVILLTCIATTAAGGILSNPYLAGGGLILSIAPMLRLFIRQEKDKNP